MSKSERKINHISLFKAVRMYGEYFDTVHSEKFELRMKEHGVLVNDKYLLPFGSIQHIMYE